MRLCFTCTLREYPGLMKSIPGVPESNWVTRSRQTISVEVQILMSERYENSGRKGHDENATD
jgi:hypothetical protein